MTRDDAVALIRRIAADPSSGSHTGESGDAIGLLGLLSDAAMAALDPAGVRRPSSRPGSGSIALEWAGHPGGYGFRLLRFQTHGYGGFYVTLDEANTNRPKPDLSAFPWSFGRPGELSVGNGDAEALVDALFAWFLADVPSAAPGA